MKRFFVVANKKSCRYVCSVNKVDDIKSDGIILTKRFDCIQALGEFNRKKIFLGQEDLIIEGVFMGTRYV